MVTSCSEKEFVAKDAQLTVEVADSDADLKTWFISSVLQNKQGRVIGENNKNLSLYFDWDKSLKRKRSDKTEGIIVPIFEFEDATIDEAKFKKVEQIAYSLRKFPRSIKALYLNKDLKGKNTYQIITYIPIKGATLSDYSGHTIFSDIKGNFLNGVVVKNNKAVGNFTDTQKQKNLKVSCGTYETIEWTTWYVNGDGEFVIVGHSATFYDSSGCGNPYNQDGAAPGDYGGGGNSGGDSGGDYSALEEPTNETPEKETIQDDGSIKKVYFKWIFLKSATANLWSRELGTMISNNDPNGPYWMFTSLDHIDTGIGGTVAGGNITIESAHATPTLGQFNASVHLAYSVKTQATYGGYPITAYYVDTAVKYFSAN